MEPTQGRSGGNRPSAAKRYGPLIVIVAIVAVIAIVVAVSSSGGDDNNKSNVTADGSTAASALRHPEAAVAHLHPGEQGLHQVGSELQHRRSAR